ncbi:group II intron maturase-specific domain-containing protein, partial [Sutterella wadsworthensis]
MYKLRPILRRGRGRSLLGTIKALTMILRGWRTYYALDDRKEVFERIDIHIRRHLRKLIWRA